MRWFHEFLGLLGAMFAFAGVVAAAARIPWYGTAAFLAFAVASFLLMVWLDAHTDEVLFVGDAGTESAVLLRGRLDEAGFAVRTCAGPDERRCPVLDGDACPVHGHPVAAVIASGAYAPCGEAMHVGTVRHPVDDPATVARVTSMARHPAGRRLRSAAAG